MEVKNMDIIRIFEIIGLVSTGILVICLVICIIGYIQILRLHQSTLVPGKSGDDQILPSDIPIPEKLLEELMKKPDEELAEFAAEITDGDVDELRLIFSMWMRVYQSNKKTYTASELQIILKFNQDLLGFIDQLIMISVEGRADLQTSVNNEYSPATIDKEISEVSTEVYNAVKQSIVWTEPLLSEEYVNQYIIRRTRHVLLQIVIRDQSQE